MHYHHDNAHDFEAGSCSAERLTGKMERKCCEKRDWVQRHEADEELGAPMGQLGSQGLMSDLESESEGLSCCRQHKGREKNWDPLRLGPGMGVGHHAILPGILRVKM